jgi:2-polyprenyl-6-methoxyphenol hydroxylase-like FAD-dependent oxidoreductase
MHTPVLIVGAGPVGMTLAAELVRYGVRVRIVDKATARTDKSKALVIWSRTLELFDRSGGAAAFIAAGFKAYAVNFMATDGKLVGRLTMDSVDSPYRYALMLPQSETERVLEERLEGLGVTVERGVEVTQLTASADGFEAKLNDAAHGETTLTADWLAGCDGAHSIVRHTIGAAFSGETMNSDWILADVHMKGYPFPDSEVSVHWHEDGAFVILPIAPGRYRVIAELPPTSDAHPRAPTLEEVQAVITRRGPPGLSAFDPIWLTGFKINGRKVASYRHGRAFLLGDAAHVHSPAGGQGMNTGIQDAFNLAWKLALVVHGTCREDLLDSYSEERSAVGDQVLKAAARLTAIGTLKNHLVQDVRNMVGHIALGLSPVRHALVETLSEVTIGYAKSPLNGAALAPRPKPGERIVPVAGQAAPGTGALPRFALFAADNAATRDLVENHPTLLDPVIRPPLHDPGLWLARPDGYVACSSIDPIGIDQYLEQLENE